MFSRRRRWVSAGLVVLLGSALAGCGSSRGPARSAPGATRATPAQPPSEGASGAGGGSGTATAGTPSGDATPTIGYPMRGAGTFDVAPSGGPVAGTSGTLLTYRVAVERGIDGLPAADFASQVTAVLSDPRGWTGTGQWRLQLVPAGARYDFTIYLATPATRDVLCGGGRDGYTSCRNGNSVVLNVARWVHGVPDYGASLTAYRQYMVNHETGHRLYNGHELCPGPGQLAPVMEQQTLGLHGCLPNSWPIVDGRVYHGRSGQYDDPIPSDPA